MSHNSESVFSTINVLEGCYNSLPPCIWYLKTCKSPGQCVILCIIVNFTVIVELSDFNLALGLLICFFFKKTMMLL